MRTPGGRRRRRSGEAALRGRLLGGVRRGRRFLGLHDVGEFGRRGVGDDVQSLPRVALLHGQTHGGRRLGTRRLTRETTIRKSFSVFQQRVILE